MPIIVCPKCRSEYDVQLKVLEKKIRCKKCGHAFRATARKSAVKKKKKSPLFWPLIGMGVGLFVVIILIVEANIDRSDKDQQQTGDTKKDQKAPASREEDRNDLPREDEVKLTEREEFCVNFINAAIDNNVERLRDMINFPAYHATRTDADGVFWNDLSETDRLFKKQEYLEAITGGPNESTNFLSGAVIEKALEKSCIQGKADVEILLRNLRNGRFEKRDFQLVKIGKNWLVAAMDVGEQYGGDLDEKEEEKPKTLDEKYTRRISPEAEIEKVDFLPGTSEQKKRELTRLAEDLSGSDRALSREAKERLIAIGKPAIPVVLNLLVGLELTNMDHVARANKCIGILREITDESFGFSPGFRAGGGSVSMEAALMKSVRLWFGWWRRNKDDWKPKPRAKKEEDW